MKIKRVVAWVFKIRPRLPCKIGVEMGLNTLQNSIGVDVERFGVLLNQECIVLGMNDDDTLTDEKLKVFSHAHTRIMFSMYVRSKSNKMSRPVSKSCRRRQSTAVSANE